MEIRRNGPAKILKNNANITKDVAFALLVEDPPAGDIDLASVQVDPIDGPQQTFDKTSFNQARGASFRLKGVTYTVVLFTTKTIAVELSGPRAEAGQGVAPAGGPPAEAGAYAPPAPPRKGRLAGGKVTVTITNAPEPIVIDIPLGTGDELME